MTIKKGDFIQIDYTGRLASGEAFDTTNEEVAKKEEIYSKKTKYGAVTVVVGEGHLIPGLDKNLVGKDIGKYSFDIADVDAFGKKSAKLLRLIPAKFFAKEQIRPYVGLQVNVDNQMGVVRSVSGGRVIVDFNHPLSSKDLKYDVEVKKLLTDNKEKVEEYFKLMGIPHESIAVNEKKAVITMLGELPEEFTKNLEADIKRLVGIESVTFVAKKKETKKEE